MSKLNLKYITEKEGDYYFKINEPEEFLKKQEYKEGTDQYYPFWKSRDSDDYLLKVKSKYIPENGIYDKDFLYSSVFTFLVCFNEREIIFFPLNDNTDKYDYGAGQHWALIIYQKSNDTFFYLDSMSCYIKNSDVFASKFISIINNKISSRKEKLPKIVKVLSEKLQFNSYDCGMFVLAFTESIMNILSSLDKKVELDEESIRVAVYSEINQKRIKQMRKEILQIIKEIQIKE